MNNNKCAVIFTFLLSAIAMRVDALVISQQQSVGVSSYGGYVGDAEFNASSAFSFDQFDSSLGQLTGVSLSYSGTAIANSDVRVDGGGGVVTYHNDTYRETVLIPNPAYALGNGEPSTILSTRYYQTYSYAAGGGTAHTAQYSLSSSALNLSNINLFSHASSDRCSASYSGRVQVDADGTLLSRAPAQTGCQGSSPVGWSVKQGSVDSALFNAADFIGVGSVEMSLNVLDAVTLACSTDTTCDGSYYSGWNGGSFTLNYEYSEYASVSEPSTALLLGVGVFGLAFVRRRVFGDVKISRK